MKISMIIPYYESPKMIERQLAEVYQYPQEFEIIIIDDCSKKYPLKNPNLTNVDCYKITTDLAWNREGVRNLGATVAKHDVLLQVDTDHILTVECAERLAKSNLDMKYWYRFNRYRIGAADDTRKKDSIPENQEFGKIKPHIDSYLCSKKLYWDVGGYNENYVGCLGGGGPFLQRMKEIGGEPKLTPADIFLQVYTKNMVKDASVTDLSRDKAEFKRRRKLYGHEKGQNPLRFDWHKLI